MMPDSFTGEDHQRGSTVSGCLTGGPYPLSFRGGGCRISTQRKTGTAQKVSGGHYDSTKWVSSFIGFAPADDPRVAIAVMVDEPQGVHYGSSVAGPLWRDAMAASLRYLNIPPSGEAMAASAPAPATRMVVAPAPAPTTDENVTVLTDEDNEARANAEEGDEPAEKREIPDFTGLSVGEALGLARQARVPVDISGTGWAVGQSPGPGPARRGVRCRISFSPSG